MHKTILDTTAISSLYIKNLCASYDKNPILKNCSLEIKPGEFICLCGPNGSGKSTLLSLLGNLKENNLKITSAESYPGLKIKNDTILLSELSRKQIACAISYLHQDEYSTWDFSVTDYVMQGRFCHTDNANYSQEDYLAAENAMKKTDTMELKSKQIHALSGGEFQKVRIARCLCQNPAFLLLDEPASNLDFTYEPKLLQQLKNLAHTQNKGIIISIHDINLAARFADKMILLKKDTTPLSGTVEQVFTAENLSFLYQTNCEIFTHPVYNCPQICEKQK